MTKGSDGHGLVRLDEEECWQFLGRHSLGRVGLVHLEQPMIFPVNYALDGLSVVFRSAPGTKLTLAAVGVNVVFEVDEASELFETGTSVMVHGTLTEVTEGDQRAALRGLPLRTWAPGDRDQLLRVAPGRLSGRQIPMQGSDDGVAADGG